MKHKLIIIISIFLILLVLIVSIKYFTDRSETPPFDGNTNTETVSKYSNEDNFKTQKLDSLEFINKISSQKLQELFDLVIVSSNNTDSKLNVILKNQLKNYFLTEDTLSLYKLRKEMDSLQIGFAKLNKITILKKDTLEADTIGKVNFTINLYKKNQKYFKTIEKSAKYVLKKNPEKLKKEFKYYFSEIGKKDTILSGVTK